MSVEFSPSIEPKLRFTDENLKHGKYDWRYFLKSFRKSWIGKIIIYLIIPFIILNFWLFRYDDFANGCHIKIHPAIIEMNNLQIKKGIKLLKAKSPIDYQEFCASVKSISPELACGGMGGGCFHPDKPDEITVSTIFRYKEYHTEYTAALIVHEVCHAIQWKEKRPMSEGECYDDLCRTLESMGVRSGYASFCSY